MNSNSSFGSHSFSDAERLWLETAAKEKPFDARGARARLHGRLPNDFDPRQIDRRFYNDDKLTLLGVRVFRPEDQIFKVIEDTVSAIQTRILREPTLDFLTVPEISALTGQSEQTTRSAIRLLSNHGSFFAGLTTNATGEVDRVLFTGPCGYDAILNVESVDSLLQKWYVMTKPLSAAFGGLFESRSTRDDTEHPQVQPKRDTAFVIMPIDPSKPELEDVLGAIKEVCQSFSIKAFRADEIEHQDRITNVILNEIMSCDILIADLSNERPNVYYEVGYAHALNKKPILYRRQGTQLHFDLSVHNVPEYRNITELRDMLRRRLEAILGRSANSA
jgi:chorismate mutase